MSKIAMISTNQLDYNKDYFDNLNQETIEDLLDQITSILDKRLRRFQDEFQRRFQGYSPELISGLIHLHKINVKNYN